MHKQFSSRYSRLNFNDLPGTNLVIFLDKLLVVPFLFFVKPLYSSFKSKIIIGAPSSAKLAANNFDKCDFPDSFLPVMIFNFPSKASASVSYTHLTLPTILLV